MQLEEILELWSEEILAGKKDLYAKAFSTLSERYRKRKDSHQPFLQTPQERYAYLFTRFPATFAAVQYVLRELRMRSAESLESLLDVGSGPGTAMWAAESSLKEMSSCTLLEKDQKFLQMGKQLAARASAKVIQDADFRICDLDTVLDVPVCDLVLCSYSLGELSKNAIARLLPILWEAARKVLVIVEPGTPKGYGRLMEMRDQLLESGGYLWSPCPHSNRCPLSPGDWCHFSVRVQRTALHKKLKAGNLGYEDEKFCYLIFGRNPVKPVPGRVLRHPIKRSGHVELLLCLENGIEKQIYSKKDQQKYKEGRKLEWGDCCDSGGI